MALWTPILANGYGPFGRGCARAGLCRSLREGPAHQRVGSAHTRLAIGLRAFGHATPA